MTTTTNSSRTLIERFWYIPLVAVLIALGTLTWANFRFAEKIQGGNDFLVHWVGTRSFIFKEQSPYSDETYEEIQKMVFGTEVLAEDPDLRVSAPFYSVILYIPFAMIGDFNIARALWMSVLEIAIMVIGITSIRLAGWRVNLWLIPFFLVFILIWYHGLRALVTGNAVVIVTLFIIGALIAIQKRQDVLAGLFLACATIKPQMVILLILLVLVWAYSHRRWTIIGWTIGSIFLLFMIGVMFMPDWLMQYIWVVIRYFDIHPILSIGSVFETMWPGIGTQLKWGFTIFMIILVLFEWWRVYGKGFNFFLWIACLTLAVSQLVGVLSDPSNIVILYPAFVLIFAIIKERWDWVGDWITLGIMIVVFFGLWGLYIKSREAGFQMTPDVFQYIPVPLLTIVGLYWIRWWVIRPTRNILSSYSN